MTDPAPTPTPRPAGAARAALLLATAWLAAGALFKLLAGSPNDLPETVRDFALLKPTWTFRFAIGIELSIVLVALLRPRMGWWLVALLFAFFDFLLFKIGQAGEKTCGCFGSNAPEWLTPFVMMVIDSALLLGVLLTRPWSRFKSKRPSLTALAAPVAILLALPWFFFQDAQMKIEVDEETGEQTQVATGEFHQFEPLSWAGQVFADTDLMQWVEGMDDPWSAFPLGSPVNVVLYSDSCEHCREHFEGLLAEPLPEGTQLVLIRIPALGDADNVVDDVKPDAFADFSLVPLPRGYGITTPVIFDIDAESFEVKNIVQGGEDE